VISETHRSILPIKYYFCAIILNRREYHFNAANGLFVMQGDGPIGGSILVRPKPKIDAVAIVLAC
jgi:hypothetical protein